MCRERRGVHSRWNWTRLVTAALNDFTALSLYSRRGYLFSFLSAKKTYSNVRHCFSEENEKEAGKFFSLSRVKGKTTTTDRSP